MNLRDLSVEEMVTVSAVLLDADGDLLPILRGHELLVGPTSVIQRAHARLLTVQQQAGSNERRVRELTETMTRLDGRHDRKARGVHKVLEGGYDLAQDEREEQIFQDLKETLFPNGLSITQRSYREQAGTAKRVQERLTDEDRERLRVTTIGSRPLLESVEEWLDTGQRIARLEAERARLQQDDSDDAVSAGEVRDARLFWIRAVKSLVTMIDFTDLDDSDKRALLANIEDAARKATEARRRAQSRAVEVSEENSDADVAEPASPNGDVPEEPGEEPTPQEDEDSEVTEPA